MAKDKVSRQTKWIKHPKLFTYLTLFAVLIGGCTASGVFHHYIKYSLATGLPSKETSFRRSSFHPNYGHHALHLVTVAKHRPRLKSAKSVFAMNASTGSIIYQRNQNQPRKIASVAKLMTLYLVEKAVHKRGDDWNAIVSSAHDRNLQKMGSNYKFGGFKFKPHHKYTVKQLFKATLIESSNNSAIALADWVAGSNQKFTEMMNTQARQWGIKARFVSPSGLETDDLMKYHLNVSDNRHSANLVSAKAVGIIAQHLIQNYPSITKLSKLSTAKVDNQVLTNANRLVPGESMPKPKARTFGLKTGYTPAAGYCYVNTSQQKNRHPMIVVILHDNNEFTDARSLINYLNKNSKSLRL